MWGHSCVNYSETQIFNKNTLCTMSKIIHKHVKKVPYHMLDVTFIQMSSKFERLFVIKYVVYLCSGSLCLHIKFISEDSRTIVSCSFKVYNLAKSGYISFYLYHILCHIYWIRIFTLSYTIMLINATKCNGFIYKKLRQLRSYVPNLYWLL